MSFGYSVGDFVILIQLADKTRRQFLDAPDEFKAISDIVKSLSPILREIEDVWLIRDLNLKQLNDLRDIAQSCEDALGRLNEKLERYQELDSHPKELGGKVHKAWKRFRWNPEEIKKLQDDIIVHVNLLDAFHGKLFGQVTLAIEDGVDRLHRRQDDREHQEMLDWLTPIDFAPQQNEIIHRRQGETGLWLLQSNEFRSWINQQSQILFCPGIPGAGKTMMSAIVVDYLMAKYRDDPSVGIAYVFCNYQSQHEQTPVAILSSLLKQLASARPALPDAIKGLNKPFNPKAERPPLDEIVKALRATLKLHSKVFIVIDALDEYRVATGDGTDEDENYAANKEALGKLLSELFQLRTEIQVSLFATSRFETDITSRFEGCVSKEIRAHDHDILKYIDSRMPKLLRSQISKHSQLQEKIRNEILNSVDGMFLLARLHMDSLMSQPTVGHINRALVDLPRGQKGLDKTYDKAVERVDEQPEASRRLARNILSWVSHARRVLSVRELQHALAVHPDMADPDEDFLPDVEILGSICAGLVRVDTGSDTVQLVHKTTEEYFKRKAILPNAEKEITVACVTYLSFDALGSFARSQGERWVREELFPLFAYASDYWGHHAARAASQEVDQIVLDFLEKEPNVTSLWQYMMFRYDYEKRQNVSLALHLAVFFGLESITAALLAKGLPPDSLDTAGRNPLSFAAQEGHEGVLSLLLAKGSQPDLTDNFGGTPLLYAAKCGHEGLVSLLLAKGTPTDSSDYLHRTPLSYAAERGHEGIVTLLLAKSSLSDSLNSTDRTPLSYAAEGGHEEIVNLLLVNGSPLDSLDTRERTPISYAAEQGHEGIVSLLLANGSPVDSPDHDRRTPLSYAARRGYKGIVSLLLGKGSSPDSPDLRGRTPLSYAAGRGYKGIVSLLLAKGSSPDSPDHDGQTPLSYAAQEGHEGIVSLLLAKGSSPDSPDHDGRTPLSYAAKSGHEGIVRSLLLAKGSSPDSPDLRGRTPLSYAAESGHEGIVRSLLLAKGSPPNSPDLRGRTPLSYAAERGHEGIVTLLLVKGSLPDSLNSTDRTPLSYTAEGGHEEIVSLLLVNGSPLDLLDTHERTPILYAAEQGHEGIVSILLAKGSAPDLPDFLRRTPLSYAAQEGDEGIVRLLLANDTVNPDSRACGKTPMEYAAERKHETIVKMLLEKRRLDDSMKNKVVNKLLGKAAEKGQEGLLKLFAAHGVSPLQQLTPCPENDAEKTIEHGLQQGLTNESLLRQAAKDGDIQVVRSCNSMARDQY